MSLVNQMLKDLEQRHAAQAQADALGIEDLHYIPMNHATEKKSRQWAILASVLVILGICTASGGYVFFEWQQRHAGVPAALQQNNTPVPSTLAAAPQVEKPQDTAVVSESTSAPATVKAQPRPAAGKPTPASITNPAKSQSASKDELVKADRPVVKINKAITATNQKDTGSMHALVQ